MKSVEGWISDGRLLNLIRAYLDSGVRQNDEVFVPFRLTENDLAGIIIVLYNSL